MELSSTSGEKPTILENHISNRARRKNAGHKSILTINFEKPAMSKWKVC
jgi:hypothetical protein